MCQLSSRKPTTLNQLCLWYQIKHVVILIETKFMNYKCFHMRSGFRVWGSGYRVRASIQHAATSLNDPSTIMQHSMRPTDTYHTRAHQQYVVSFKRNGFRTSRLGGDQSRLVWATTKWRGDFQAKREQLKLSTTFTWKPRLESGLDCLIFSEFAKRRLRSEERAA